MDRRQTVKLTEQLVRSGSRGIVKWAWTDTVSPGEPSTDRDSQLA